MNELFLVNEDLDAHKRSNLFTQVPTQINYIRDQMVNPKTGMDVQPEIESPNRNNTSEVTCDFIARNMVRW